MAKFAIVRLGKDSIGDIKAIDALHSSPNSPVTFTVKCSQVPSELDVGDLVFVCLGSDNNQGTPTAWIRGLRALGTVATKAGGPGWQDKWDIGLSVKVVLPQSITQMDLLGKAPTAYFWCSAIPVLGVDTHANQTVQMIKDTEQHQNVDAFLYAINSIHPTFKPEAVAAYPVLATRFNYIPPVPFGPHTSGGGLFAAIASVTTLSDIVEHFLEDCNSSGLRIDAASAQRFFASLLTKRFLIATGLAGSGKTKLAQAVSTWLTPQSSAFDPFKPGTSISSDKISYFIRAADGLSVEFWNSEKEDEATKVVLPRELIGEWAAYIEANNIPRITPARDIRSAVKGGSRFSDQLHSFETHLKAAALASIEAQAVKGTEKCYEIVPVGADWTGNENVLGYANGLDEKTYVTKAALDLMIRAKHNPDTPHILILDEMNLSHVERYFSDVLSVIESDETIHLHRDADRKSNGVQVPNEIELPKNLFIVGTVNVDETTYMFSPKVLDRANVIEFRMDETDLTAFLGNPAKPDMDLLAGKGAAYGRTFVEAARSKAPGFVPALQSLYEAEMLLFFKALRGNGAEYGYRVAHEAARFVHFFKLVGGHEDDPLDWFEAAFDCLISQKFLPKLHGSRAKLGPLLKKLWFLSVSNAAARGDDPYEAVEAASRSTEKKHEPALVVPADAPYKLSAEKIGRMWRLLNENGFASFAEA